MTKRIAIVNKDKCHPQECGNLCMKKCPVNKMGEECMFIDPESQKVGISENLCVGCGICPRICPFGALEIINLPEELDSKPIHRYAENAFSLYNLPVPIFGKVVGLLGRNGIGKSTAMKILAGVLSPNFEEESKGFPKDGIKNNNKSSIKDLIDYFKGSEAQAYFEKLEQGDIKVSFKPQQVELIPKAYSGTVEGLLRKVDETNSFDEIVTKLGLENILERDISKISGGELQIVAIAATVLKDANVFFFDEPSSYLDIKQRLKVAKFIRELTKEDKAVMVIEHDLIILDYLTDFIHIIFGKESAYGIVSQLKPTKKGINTYLSGFLKEENIRFRDQEIKFDSHPEDEEISILKLISWNDFEKKIGSFELKVNEGVVHRNDIIGVLGENGIGKSSFIKELVLASKDESKVAKITSSETIKELRVAYKPQQIIPSDEIVRIYLKDALRYDVQLIRPLNLEPLLDNQLDKLSGGELQKVVIAKTLSEDADIYLFDEPSAYLDVEQRLSLSKVFRNMMEIKKGSALVIDHDLLFIDYISKRLLIFDGKPAVKGEVTGPYSMIEGMNNFLQGLDITFRRDESNNRPRVNKVDSQKDKEQKASGNLYYA